MDKMRKICIIAILSIFSLSVFTSEASAASSIIQMKGSQANKVGSSFTTTETISRANLVTFLDHVKRAEKDANLMNTARWGIASSVITFPLKRLGVSVGAGTASSVISFFVINKDLGSKVIQNKLNTSRASKFKIKITYKRYLTRGTDVFYRASSVKMLAG